MNPRNKKFPHIILLKANTKGSKRVIKIYNDDGDERRIIVINRPVKLPNGVTTYNLDLIVIKETLSNGKIEVVED